MKREIFIVITILLISIMILIGIFGNDHIQNLNNIIKDYKTKINNLENEKNNKPEYNLTNDNNTYSCEYTRTYKFLEYYKHEGTTNEEYYITLEQYQSNIPLIEKLSINSFPKNFKKNQNYEITYRKKLNYLRGFLDETTEIVKIEPTNLEGMNQKQNPCILTTK